MRKMLKGLDTVLGVLSVIGLVGFIISAAIQIFSRTFLPKIPSWTEEASRYLFIYSVAFGCGLVARRNEFVIVDFLVDRLKPGARKVQRVLVDILVLAFNIFMIFYSVPKFVFMKYRMVSTAMEIPMKYIYFSMMALFAVQALCYLIQIYLELTGRQGNIKEVTNL